MLNRIPFYLLSQQEKKDFIQNIYQNYSLYFLEPEGLLPTGWAPAIRFVFLITITSATLFELFYKRRKIFDILFQIGKNKEIYRFQLLVTSILFFGIIASFVGVILQLKMHIDGNRLIVVSIWIELIIISLYLFAQPKILYGITGWVQEQESVKSIDETNHSNTLGVEEDDENIDYITIHRGRNILKTIDEHFRLNHPYTKIGYTITDLSKEINIPVYLISVVINQEFGNNFNEFVNDARVSYLKTWKKSDSNFDNYSIEYIGNAVGFASRTSFIAAVKKRTGLLPKDYLIQL
ncbi:helix-turn-helix transcriptional regulator [Aquirufa aurantiipilula]